MERIEIDDVVSWKLTGATGPVDPNKITTIINTLIQEIECLKGGKKGRSVSDLSKEEADELVKAGKAYYIPKEPTTGGWEERFENWKKEPLPEKGWPIKTTEEDLKAFIAREKEASYKEGYDKMGGQLLYEILQQERQEVIKEIKLWDGDIAEDEAWKKIPMSLLDRLTNK
jgi:hypothetical protein